nr:uncharacterized protein LOC116806881 isoform X3 [Taeniopygia guttata]
MPLNPPAVAAPPLQISLPHRAHSPGLGSGRAACLASFPAAISRVLLDPHPTPTNPHLPPLWHRCFRSKKMKETIMNQEKLAKLQAQVRIGGKFGSAKSLGVPVNQSSPLKPWVRPLSTSGPHSNAVPLMGHSSSSVHRATAKLSSSSSGKSTRLPAPAVWLPPQRGCSRAV